MGLKIEDIIFWILILLIIGIALWLFHGSPTLEASLISIALFIAGSELLIWKKLFSMDKNTAIGFVKIKNDLNNLSDKLNLIGGL